MENVGTVPYVRKYRKLPTLMLYVDIEMYFSLVRRDVFAEISP